MTQPRMHTTAGPIDPRLLRLSAQSRRWILLLAILTALRTISVVGFGLLVAFVASDVIADPSQTVADNTVRLACIAGLAIAQAGLVWLTKRFGRKAAAQATADLRERALQELAYRDPRSVDTALWRTLLTDGVDGLGPYLTGYLPALLAMLIATPATVAVVWWLDLRSALIAIITLPLIPVFMWLVGTLTAGLTEKRLADLSVLADQIVDLIAGLPTLRAVGRLRTPAAEVQRLSRRNADSSMSVLRIAFLSSFVLEFFATLSVAVIAVGIGFRLLDGGITLAAALAVLIIVPEVYNPARAVGARFHDARDGFVAVERILEILDAQSSIPTANPTVSPAASADERAPGGLTVVFDALTAEGRDGPRPREVTGTAQPGRITVLVGDNGAGKTTALLAALGIATDGVSGRAEVQDATGMVLAGKSLWQHTSYLPQRPVLDPGAVGDHSGLSLGQRQRVALAEQLAQQRELLVLDEPTAHVDVAAAEQMVTQLRERAQAGATVLMAGHDPLLVAAADEVIEVVL